MNDKFLAPRRRQWQVAVRFLPRCSPGAVVALLVVALVLLAGSLNDSRDVPPEDRQRPASGSLSQERLLTLDTEHAARATEDQLKRRYLECARDTTERRMDVDTATRCALVAEILVARSFDNDLERLLEWWRMQAAPDVAIVSQSVGQDSETAAEDGVDDR